MKTRWLWIITSVVVVLSLLLGVFGCPAPTPTQTTPAQTTPAKTTPAQTTPAQPKTVLIGMSEDLTGLNSEAGKNERDGAILAIEEWNAKGGVHGMQIEYVVRDNVGDPVKATTIAKEFINMGIIAAIGGTSSTVGIPESQAFTAAMIPMMGCAASDSVLAVAPDGKWYYFANGNVNINTGPVLVERFKEKGYKRIASIVSNHVWAKGLRDIMKQGMEENAAEYGFELIADIEVDTAATDMTAQLVKIKALNPDCIQHLLFGVNQLAYVNGLKTIDWSPPITVAHWNLAETVYLSSDPKLFANSTNWAQANPGKPAYIQKMGEFMARFSYQPTVFWAYSYDGMNCLLQAIDAVGADSAAIRDYIATKTDYVTIIGKVGARAIFTKENYNSQLLPKDFSWNNIDANGKTTWE